MKIPFTNKTATDTIRENMNPDLLPFVYYKDAIYPYEQAGLGLATNSLHYGSLIFGGMRGYIQEDGRIAIFRMYDHYIRLMQAAKILAYDIELSFDTFRTILFELIKANKPTQNFYIRPFIFADKAQLGPKLRNLSFVFATYMQTLNNYNNPEIGMRMLTSSFPKYSDNALSTKAKVAGGYVNSMMATHQANIAGFDEALLFNNEGYLAEASVANVLIDVRGKLLTPPLSAGALEGITMRSVVELLAFNNIDVTYQNIDRSTLYATDELIITGTAVQISYAQEVDGRLIAKTPGPITTLLQEEMQKVMQNKHELSKKWLCFVE